MKKKRFLSIVATIILTIGGALLPCLSSVAQAVSLNGDKGWKATDSIENSYSNITVSKKGNSYHAYCYSPFIQGPAQSPKTTSYERYGYYEGMNNLSSARGDRETIQHIAAVLVAGYPNDKAGLSYLAEESMQKAKEAITKLGKGTPNWKTTKDFMNDATQLALWAQIKEKIPQGSSIPSTAGGTYYPNEFNGIVGKTPKEAIETLSPYREIFNTPYAQALYQYGQQHFVDTETAKAENVQLVDSSGKELSDSNPLIVKNGKSSTFSLNNYNGAVELDNLDGLKLYDADTNKVVQNNTIESGKKYYLQGNSSNAKISVSGQYAAIGESYFWEPDVEPYPQRQNLVYLNVVNKKLSLPVVNQNQVKQPIVISKQDVSGKEIAGAELELTQNGNKVDSWTSEEGKSHNFSAEADKEYVLTETQRQKAMRRQKALHLKWMIKAKSK